MKLYIPKPVHILLSPREGWKSCIRCYFLRLTRTTRTFSTKMPEKQVTIDAPSQTSSWKEPGRQTPNHDSTRRTIILPKHMYTSGQDGYRTPTIEDFEMQHGRSPMRNGCTTTPCTTPVHRVPVSPNNSPQWHLPYYSPGADGRQHLSLSNASLAHSMLQKLEWRERIRHYTWTFFTMTMATGGIANVLYNGISLEAFDALKS